MYLIIYMFVITSLNAVTITGQGYGINEQESLEESLSDLSNKISVQVKSNFKSYIVTDDATYNKRKEKLIELSSSLPIKNVNITVMDGEELTKTTTSITTKHSLPAYMSELNRLSKNIKDTVLKLHQIKRGATALKYKILIQLLQDVENFNKHKIVAIILNARDVPVINITESKVKTEILELEDKVLNIELAAKVLSKGIMQESIYISAIRMSGSNEVTQFAKILKDSMSKTLNISKYSSDAKYLLRGNYEILDDGIFITLRLSDKKNNIIKVSTITLAPSAYKHIDYKVKTKTFDKSLSTEHIISSDLHIDIGFRGFNRVDGIDLVEKDEIDIVVKSSKSVCYFIVGHILKEKEKFSYLLPIGSEDTPFISSITGSNVNRAIIIAEDIPVSEPFGSESLQIFANTFKEDGTCPIVVPFCKENQDELCVITGKPNEVIKNTRALNFNKRKFKVEKADNSISFTSFKMN